MDFETLTRVKESVDTFNDAEFVSLVNENTVLIKSLRNESVWKIGFAFNEEDILVFDTTAAECVQEGDENADTIVASQNKSLKENLIKMFSFDESEREEAKATVRSLFENTISDEEFATLKASEKEFSSALSKSLVAEGTIPEVAKIADKFGEKYGQWVTAESELIESASMFAEDFSIKKEKFVDPIHVLDVAEFKRIEESSNDKMIESIMKFKSSLDESYGAKIGTYIFENIRHDSTLPKILKTIVTAKKTMDADGKIGSVNEEAKKLEGMLKETFSEVYSENAFAAAERPSPVIFNQIENPGRYRFLGYKTGIFEMADLNAMIEEFQSVKATYLNNMSREDLLFISEMESRIMYMQRTNNISDQVVADVLGQFGQRFARTQTGPVGDNGKLGFVSDSERASRNFNFGTKQGSLMKSFNEDLGFWGMTGAVAAGIIAAPFIWYTGKAILGGARDAAASGLEALGDAIHSKINQKELKAISDIINGDEEIKKEIESIKAMMKSKSKKISKEDVLKLKRNLHQLLIDKVPKNLFSRLQTLSSIPAGTLSTKPTKREE